MQFVYRIRQTEVRIKRSGLLIYAGRFGIIAKKKGGVLMKLFLMLLGALAAGVTVKALHRKHELESPLTDQTGQCYDLSDEEAVLREVEAEDAPLPEAVERPAVVTAAWRAMDPVSFKGASVVTFLLEDGEERTLHIPGDNGQHLQVGDRGLLESQGDQFISFVKENGEVVGALYHIPANAVQEE